MFNLALACRLEAAAVRGWPAAIEEPAPGGWLLRATPGLDRGRSNHALTPCRRLDEDEIEPALGAVVAFAERNGIRPGIQVSPLELHDNLDRALDGRGWKRQWPVRVLAGTASEAEPAPERTAGVDVADHATDEWLRAWAQCEPERDVDAHARTVLERLSGRAVFARLSSEAVGIGVPVDGLLGLYCVAVRPDRRQRGLGTGIVRLLMRFGGCPIAFLQVEEENRAALGLYERLGFRESHRYRHRVSG